MTVFNVSTEALRDHARVVSDLGERISRAAEAARYLSGLDDAYGVLGRPIAAAIIGDTTPMAEKTGKIADLMQTLNVRLNTVADKFDEMDWENHRKIDTKGRDLDRLDDPAKEATDHSQDGPR